MTIDVKTRLRVRRISLLGLRSSEFQLLKTGIPTHGFESERKRSRRLAKPFARTASFIAVQRFARRRSAILRGSISRGSSSPNCDREGGADRFQKRPRGPVIEKPLQPPHHHEHGALEHRPTGGAFGETCTHVVETHFRASPQS